MAIRYNIVLLKMFLYVQNHHNKHYCYLSPDYSISRVGSCRVFVDRNRGVVLAITLVLLLRGYFFRTSRVYQIRCRFIFYRRRSQSFVRLIGGYFLESWGLSLCAGTQKWVLRCYKLFYSEKNLGNWFLNATQWYVKDLFLILFRSAFLHFYDLANCAFTYQRGRIRINTGPKLKASLVFSECKLLL